MTIDLNYFPLLQNIHSPSDLRQLSDEQLPALARELREFLLQSLNVCGGHFGANLGTVELTLALHYIFDTPHDYLIWDVGHQAYPHKVLTGRRDQLTTIRQTHGLAPFPHRQESIYDPFGVGHSSTSISAALGMALAAKLDGSQRKAIAVIGDGAMTAGMAFEALNHAGALHANLLVVLNDNDMSISNNVGALSNYFARILSGSTYTHLREGGKRVLQSMPSPMREFVKRTELQMKGLLAHGVKPGTLFEELGFNYIGPIDGHDLETLLTTLRNLAKREGPQLLHVVTKKGKGYAPAEHDQIAYHAVKPGFYQPQQTESSVKKAAKPTYSNIFGQWLCDMAAMDERLVGITPAMREGSDLIKFSEQFPDRYFDVAIAEQHSVTLAAGLACAGKKPVVAIYSTFLQRAYDQLIHDVALQNLPVVFAMDRSGLVGGDGATHNGSFDLSYLRCIPNMIVMAPSDENETRQMLYTAFMQDEPAAVRYPRGTGPGVEIQQTMQAYEIGKAHICRQGKKIALLAFGSMVNVAKQIADHFDATVVNMRFVKPLDEKLLRQLAATHDVFITLEENSVLAGAGSAVNEYLLRENLLVPILNLGLPDHFIEHGDPDQLLAECGLDAKGVKKSIEQFLEKIKRQAVKLVVVG